MCALVVVVVCECRGEHASGAHKSWRYQRSGLGRPRVLLLNVIVAGRPLARYFLVRNQDQSRGSGGGEGEDGKETMTDGHWRRGEEEGIRVGVGGGWRCFKAPATSER